MYMAEVLYNYVVLWCAGEMQDLARDNAELINQFLSYDAIATTLAHLLMQQRAHDEAKNILTSAM